jgi:tetratricopeptide (TPR) repeat protein
MAVWLLALLLGIPQGGTGQRALPDLPLQTYAPTTRAALERVYQEARRRPDDEKTVGRLGRTLHAWEQWDAALQVYARAQQLAPREFDWVYLEGVVLQRLARHADAALAFRRAMQLRPEYLPARVKLAESLLESGAVGEGAALFDALAKEPAAAPVAELGLGRLAARAGRHADAVAHLRRAIDLFPELGAAHYALALSYGALGRQDDARDALRKHQQYGPRWPAVDDPVLLQVTALKDDAGALVRQGTRLAEDGDLVGAIAAHEAALQRNPALAQVHANLMSLYGRQKNWAKAEEHYRALVNLGLNLGEAHYNYGVLLVLQERWDEAARAYRDAIAVNPLHAEAHNNLGQMIERERRWEEAAREYRAAVVAQPSFRLARFNLGRMLIALGQLDEAIAELNRLRQPEDAETARYVFALAAAHMRAGRRVEGLECAAEARRLALAHGQNDLVAAIDRDVAALKR